MTQLEEFKEWLEADESRKTGINNEEWETFFSQHEELLNCDWEDEENEEIVLGVSVQGRNEQRMFDKFSEWLSEKKSRKLISKAQEKAETANAPGMHSQEEYSKKERTRLKKWWLFGLTIAAAVGIIGIGLKAFSSYSKEEINDLKRGCAVTFSEKNLSEGCEKNLEWLWKREILAKKLKTQIRDKRIELEEFKRNLIGKSLGQWEAEEFSHRQDELSGLEKELEILRRKKIFKEIEEV